MNRQKTDHSQHACIITTALMFFFLFLAPPAAYSSEFILLFSNDIRGETEPCG